MIALEHFSAPTRAWFEAAFAAPTPAQEGAWQAIAAGRHALVVAPTGSGKTLSAFLHGIDSLLTKTPPEDRSRRCRVLYVSPLKALAVDVERNLRAPLAGIRHTAERLGTTVPELGTDMIFALIGQELGLFGMVVVILAFGFVTHAGYGIAHRAPTVTDRVARLPPRSATGRWRRPWPRPARAARPAGARWRR